MLAIDSLWKEVDVVVHVKLCVGPVEGREVEEAALQVGGAAYHR